MGAETIHHVMDKYIANQEMAGGALIVRKNDKVVFDGKWGYADSASHHVDGEYPAVYLVQALDDDTVPKQDAKDLQAALVAANIRHQMERGASGGHGFGLGSATPADGWVERAVSFMEDRL